MTTDQNFLVLLIDLSTHGEPTIEDIVVTQIPPRSPDDVPDNCLVLERRYNERATSNDHIIVEGYYVPDTNLLSGCNGDEIASQFLEERKEE